MEYQTRNKTVSIPRLGDDLDAWEHRLEAQVEADPHVRQTEKEALVRARRGRGPAGISRVSSEQRIAEGGAIVASNPCRVYMKLGMDEALPGYAQLRPSSSRCSATLEAVDTSGTADSYPTGYSGRITSRDLTE